MIFGIPFFPIFHPHPRSVLTNFGVTTADIGTQMKMRLL
jgi:hypothetical protein